jgi:hypothetical protein
MFGSSSNWMTWSISGSLEGMQVQFPTRNFDESRRVCRLFAEGGCRGYDEYGGNPITRLMPTSRLHDGHYL